MRMWRVFFRNDLLLTRFIHEIQSVQGSVMIYGPPGAGREEIVRNQRLAQECWYIDMNTVGELPSVWSLITASPGLLFYRLYHFGLIYSGQESLSSWVSSVLFDDHVSMDGLVIIDNVSASSFKDLPSFSSPNRTSLINVDLDIVRDGDVAGLASFKLFVRDPIQDDERHSRLACLCEGLALGEGFDKQDVGIITRVDVGYRLADCIRLREEITRYDGDVEKGLKCMIQDEISKIKLVTSQVDDCKGVWLMQALDTLCSGAPRVSDTAELAYHRKANGLPFWLLPKVDIDMTKPISKWTNGLLELVDGPPIIVTTRPLVSYAFKELIHGDKDFEKMFQEQSEKVFHQQDLETLEGDLREWFDEKEHVYNELLANEKALLEEHNNTNDSEANEVLTVLIIDNERELRRLQTVREELFKRYQRLVSSSH
mmetsp:Transcript_25674/g.41374  ORF Transcript_25674/g.41374 Transcript_25674/m.41374 type:complete len:427 (-) Transcript_25674:758-2038(-)